MAYSPIAFIAPNYSDYGTYWLKAYLPGSTTPKLLAIELTAATTFAKLQLNVDGFFKSTGGALITPYVEGPYDAYLFQTEAEADANNTAGAIRLADNITPLTDALLRSQLAAGTVDVNLINDLTHAYEFSTVASYVSFSSIFPVGKVIHLLDRAATFIVITGTGTATGNKIIASSLFSQSIELEVNDTANALQFGAAVDGITDSSLVYAEMFSSGARTIVFPKATYRGKISQSSLAGVDIIFEEGATLQSFTTDQVVAISSSSSVTLSGGEFTTAQRVSRPIAITSCTKTTVTNAKVSFATKSAYSGSAIYSNAGIYLENCSRCIVQNNELFNIEGFGVACVGTGEGNEIKQNYIHDNLGGILNNGDSNNHNKFVENDIGFNNVSGGSGNDGILINATSIALASSGHLVTHNRIYNSGEHGMYAQCGNSIISNNTVYANAECGIKVAKCRNTSVLDNICHSNQSNLQVQSGFENVLVQGNNCKGAVLFDLGFTWNTALDAFGGRNVKVIGNYFHSEDPPNWSITADGTEGIHIEGNSCKKGLIYTGNATPVGYSNVTIRDNEFLTGVIRVVKSQGALISGNVAQSLHFNDSNSNGILNDNIFTALTVDTRKDLQVEAFKSICGNKITSTDPSGAPNFELFNGQEAVVDRVRICNNEIKTSGAIIFNINTAGGITNSVISNNTFDAGGGNTIGITTNANINAIIGNVGLIGTITTTNSTAIGNTGGTTFSGAGSSFANNL
jgi:parallel beta-helix repeat protein